MRVESGSLLCSVVALLVGSFCTHAIGTTERLDQEVQVSPLGAVAGDRTPLPDPEHSKLGSWGVIGSIDDVDHMPTAREFWEEYVVKWQPLIVRGAGATMPATELWNLEYLSNKFGNLTVRVEAARENRANPGNIKGGMSLSELMAKGARGEDVYAISNVAHPM